MLKHNLVKLYVHCELNETIEMTFKIETKLDTWHINCKLKKNFWKKKFLKKNFLEKFFFQKNFCRKKIFKKKFFFLKNFKNFFLKKIVFKKKIFKKIFFSEFFFPKNRICQTEFSNATKHLQKSNRHKESFFPTLACVTWPDLSPEL